MTPALIRPGGFQPPTPIPLDDLGGISFLLVGDYGGGKTHFLMTMPQPIVVGYTDPNLAVVKGFKAQGVQVECYPLDTWEAFQWFTRRTKNREWNARTVAIDSYTYMGSRLVMEKQEVGSNVKTDGALKQNVWGHVLNDQWQEIIGLCDATQPITGKAAYNIVVTVHERPEYETMLGPPNRAGGEPTVLTKLVGVDPAIPGGFREHVGRMFDCVFTVQQRPRREKGADNIVRVTGTDHVLCPIPPDNLRSTKDGFGGKAGRKELPAVVPNTWPELCAAWGVDPDTLKVLGG